MQHLLIQPIPAVHRPHVKGHGRKLAVVAMRLSHKMLFLCVCETIVFVTLAAPLAPRTENMVRRQPRLLRGAEALADVMCSIVKGAWGSDGVADGGRSPACRGGPMANGAAAPSAGAGGAAANARPTENTLLRSTRE